jgi:mono/diheme cytochrome c family protein
MMSFRPRALLTAAFVAGLGLPLAPPRAPAGDAAVSFVRDIKPILDTRCVTCHGPTKRRSGLRLDRKEDAFQGGDSGPAIVPHAAADSPLLRRVASTEPNERMPPQGERLDAEQVALLRRWIDQGAPWPATEGGDDPRRAHWAFQPVRRPAVPRLPDERWSRNAIDRFILARLDRAGLRPSPEADRPALLRRLKFDLLGLPPAPEEVDAFVNDPAADAYERLAERYLASPHFGERWARHWLDVVRFAESQGFEMNQPRPNAWPYRDYVIRAFNEDLPYDRFVTEHLAGDLLGADEATGFLVAGPWDQVKSPDPALTAQQRADELHDIVSTTGSTFLGLTVGCARCHDHKFDPVAMRDYYGLVAVFAGVEHGERPARAADSGQRHREAEELRHQAAAVAAELGGLEPMARPQGPPGRRVPVNARLNVERFTPRRAKYVRFIIEATSGTEPCLDELEVFTSGPSPRNVALASAGGKATSSGDYAGAPSLHRLEHVNDGRYGNGRSWISNEVGRGWVQVELRDAAVIDRVVWARDREGVYADRLPTRYRVEVAADPGSWVPVASSEDRLPPGSAAAAPPALGERERARYQRLAARRAELEGRLAALGRPPMVYAGRFTAPGPTHRLNRGDATQPREAVAPGALAAFGPPLDLAADAPESQRRLVLARWITDPRRPLTARVIVNRLWQHHFGRGLVPTPSDFGLNGGRPSHPELLDWLAAELVAHGWGLKHLHRLIVLSATYRQASAAEARGLAADAQDRWLWRYPPCRLEAESLRDAILAVSGTLDLRMGGPGFDLFEPNTNYVKVYTPKKEFGPAEWRRMVYQSKPRMQLDDTFGAFDCPDAGQIAPQRNRSTTALQALNLSNSRFVAQQAGLFAERLRREAGDDPAAQARRGFRLAFGREPSAEEEAAAARLIRAHGAAAFCRALLNANEFLYVF